MLKTFISKIATIYYNLYDNIKILTNKKMKEYII